MKRSLIAPVLALLLTASCQSTGQDINNHWSARSIAPRSGRFLLGYNAEKDGTYRDFQWERKQDINLTLRRYFFHHNPDNPYQAEIEDYYQPRPNHSIAPNPINYIHLEGALLGFITLGVGGIYMPLPVDSFIGTLEPGGMDEFVSGLEVSLSPVAVVTSSFVNGWVQPGVNGILDITHLQDAEAQGYAQVTTLND